MNNNRDNPLVSIVLPTYNRAYVLPYAIKSVLGQTYKNIELIIVDDNSPDATPDVVKSFTDPRIRYFRNNPNLKLPRALNKGFALARGDFLTWTSDDNLYEPTAIEKMVAVMSADNYDFVYADYYMFSDLDANARPIDPRHEHLPNKLQLDKSNHIGACFMYTRKLYEQIGEYDPELFLVEDYDYFIRIAEHFPIHHIPEPLYYFRRDDNTLYHSRFCEVKASDVLVRYKNNLLNDDTALDAVVALILRNIEDIKNPVLKWAYRTVKNVSYRLTNLHLKLTEYYLKIRLRSQVKTILEAYRSSSMTFKDARDKLAAIMQRFGSISPKTKKQ